MKTEFNTTDFEFNHGRKPSGIGHWAFATVRNPTPEQIYWFAGSFGAAKKAAQDFFSKQPDAWLSPIIYVQS